MISPPQQQDSSPWQQRAPDNPPSKPAKPDSIWQMLPTREIPQKKTGYYEEEESSAGGAYGVYSMPVKKNRPKKKREIQKVPEVQPEVQQPAEEEERPPSPEDFEFKKPLTGSPKTDPSTNESTPRHQARKEEASGEEKVSLLDDEGEVAEVELSVEEGSCFYTNHTT